MISVLPCRPVISAAFEAIALTKGIIPLQECPPLISGSNDLSSESTAHRMIKEWVLQPQLKPVILFY